MAVSVRRLAATFLHAWVLRLLEQRSAPFGRNCEGVLSSSAAGRDGQAAQSFTAANLEKIAGIQVQWTSNLAGHLSLKDDEKKVMLFHQVSFLELSKDSQRYATDFVPSLW